MQAGDQHTAIQLGGTVQVTIADQTCREQDYDRPTALRQLFQGRTRFRPSTPAMGGRLEDVPRMSAAIERGNAVQGCGSIHQIEREDAKLAETGDPKQPG